MADSLYQIRWIIETDDKTLVDDIADEMFNAYMESIDDPESQLYGRDMPTMFSLIGQVLPEELGMENV